MAPTVSPIILALVCAGCPEAGFRVAFPKPAYLGRYSACQPSVGFCQLAGHSPVSSPHDWACLQIPLRSASFASFLTTIPLPPPGNRLTHATPISSRAAPPSISLPSFPAAIDASRDDLDGPPTVPFREQTHAALPVPLSPSLPAPLWTQPATPSPSCRAECPPSRLRPAAFPDPDAIASASPSSSSSPRPIRPAASALCSSPAGARYSLPRRRLQR